MSSMQRWSIWAVYALAWTAALLMPLPIHGEWRAGVGELEVNLRYFVAKAAHMSAYALLAVLTGWLRAPVRQRFLLMFLLMGHATLTELIQEATSDIAGRTGKLHDVGFDHLGIALGVMLSWKWWTQE